MRVFDADGVFEGVELGRLGTDQMTSEKVAGAAPSLKAVLVFVDVAQSRWVSVRVSLCPSANHSILIT